MVLPPTVAAAVLVAVVGAGCCCVASWRAGRRRVLAACAAVALVVVYSVALYDEGVPAAVVTATPVKQAAAPSRDDDTPKAQLLVDADEQRPGTMRGDSVTVTPPAQDAPAEITPTGQTTALRGTRSSAAPAPTTGECARPRPPEELYRTTPVEAPTPERPLVYTFRIQPLPECGCSADNQARPVCSGHAYFEVRVWGPGVRLTGAVTKDVTAEGVGWNVNIRVPEAHHGTFVAETRLFLHDYPHMYTDYETRAQFLQLMSHRAVRATYPDASFMHRRLHSNVTFTVPVTSAQSSADFRSTLPLCSQLAPSPNLPGYWDAAFKNYFPFECRLQSLRPNATEGFENTDKLKQALASKWIAFYGDSNTRNFFHFLCDVLGAETYPPESRAARGKGTKMHACFQSSFLLTETIWWPSSYPYLHELLRTTRADELLLQTGAAEDVVQQWNRTQPDMIAVSLSTHDPNTLKLGPLALDMIKKGMPAVLEDDCKRLLLLSITASDPALIPDKFPGANVTFLIQNNARAERTNAIAQATFPPSCKHVDMFSLSLAPNLNGFVGDAVHLKAQVYNVAVDMIMNYIAASSI